MILYNYKYTITEGFNQNGICKSYLKESLYIYPCTNHRVKKHFLDWCGSYKRRNGIFPNLPDSVSRFYRIRDDYLTLDSLRQ